MTSFLSKAGFTKDGLAVGGESLQKLGICRPPRAPRRFPVLLSKGASLDFAGAVAAAISRAPAALPLALGSWALGLPLKDSSG